MIDLADELQKSIRKAAALIKSAKRAVSLTGAGYSTPSGIPDFRSANSGLWERHDPMEVASLSTFRFQPKKFFDWFRPLAAHIYSAIPNPAHVSLAQLEKAGYLFGVITQNIDGLHQRAGSLQVFEVHGSLAWLVCTSCYTRYSSQQFFKSFIDDCSMPVCSSCGHILKPDVILFEEQLPIKTWKLAEKAAATCDLMLIAGSSLTVFPAANLPLYALENRVPLIVINKTPTYIDNRADVVIYGDLAEIIPRLASEVLGE